MLLWYLLCQVCTDSTV